MFHLVLLYQVRVCYVSFSVIISGSCVLYFIWCSYIMFVCFMFHLVFLYHVRVFYVSFSVIISSSCVLCLI